MSEVLAALGVVVAAAAAAAAIVLPPGRIRAAAMVLALGLFPLLILGDQWHSPQIEDLRDEPAGLIALALAATATAVVLLAAAFRRWPVLLPLAIVAAVPFRVPLEAGGDTANLLVPLYLVIGAGVLAAAVGEWPDGDGVRDGPAALLSKVLAAVVVLYALQTLYSPDFSKSLQNVCFFFVPFSLAYALLRRVDWNRDLLVAVLWVAVLESLAFVAVGSVEYLTRGLLWNDQVSRANEFHTYFRVNSVFWDPNIYGRYLALAIVIAMSAILWAREQRTLALLTGIVAVLWIGLVPTFSQSSFAGLLGGLAILAALRWSWRWTLAAVAVAGVFGTLVVLFVGGNSTISLSRINIDTGGRANLISGGVELFAQRPVWGYGSGSFPRAYVEHVVDEDSQVSVSHTEPVTVAAEQGLIGLAAYAALLFAALWTMASGLFTARQGRGPPDSSAEQAVPAGPEYLRRIARIAVFAAFVALLVHTMAYAGFYEDPIAWVLLAAAASLAASPPTSVAVPAVERERVGTRG